MSYEYPFRLTKSFGFSALVVSYSYFSNAQTLYEAHMKPKPLSPTYQQAVYYGRHQQRHQQQLQAQQQSIPERTLWSYIIQLSSAIKKVHEQGQAVRVIDVSKVLVTGQNRFVRFLSFLPRLIFRSDSVRIGSCGIFDVLLFGTPQQDISLFQQDDFLKLGRLIFALCTNNVSASNQTNMQKSLEMMKKVYSVDVQALALFLCSKIPKVSGGRHELHWMKRE